MDNFISFSFLHLPVRNEKSGAVFYSASVIVKVNDIMYSVQYRKILMSIFPYCRIIFDSFVIIYNYGVFFLYHILSTFTRLSLPNRKLIVKPLSCGQVRFLDK